MIQKRYQLTAHCGVKSSIHCAFSSVSKILIKPLLEHKDLDSILRLTANMPTLLTGRASFAYAVFRPHNCRKSFKSVISETSVMFGHTFSPCCTAILTGILVGERRRRKTFAESIGHRNRRACQMFLQLPNHCKACISSSSFDFVVVSPEQAIFCPSVNI